jgi:hypothetical protein
LRGFLDDALIDGAIEYSRPLELPPLPWPTHYKAAVDASGGAGLDAYTLAIAHRERSNNSQDIYVIDAVRGTKGKFDPHVVTAEYATLLKDYRIKSVTGDRYSKEWIAGAWRQQNILYVESQLNKSQIYLECEPLFARGLLRLPDHPILLRELVCWSGRRTAAVVNRSITRAVSMMITPTPSASCCAPWPPTSPSTCSACSPTSAATTGNRARPNATPLGARSNSTLTCSAPLARRWRPTPAARGTSGRACLTRGGGE